MAPSSLLSRPMLGAISPEKMYPLASLSAVSGFGTGALRTLRRKGLNVHYCCGKAFVLGADFIAAVKANSKPTK